MNYASRRIVGRWRRGEVLDIHTISSKFVGYDEFGRERFDTVRSEAGELLNRLKYHGDEAAVRPLVLAAEQRIDRWGVDFDAVVPVPPSVMRAEQPVMVLANALADQLNVPFLPVVRRSRQVPQLKNVFEREERLRLLEDLHRVKPRSVDGMALLLVDDLYRSGATMNSVAGALYDAGAADVWAFAFTMTRTRR